MFTNSDIISTISLFISDGRIYKNFIILNKFVYNSLVFIHHLNVKRLTNPFFMMYNEHGKLKNIEFLCVAESLRLRECVVNNINPGKLVRYYSCAIRLRLINLCDLVELLYKYKDDGTLHPIWGYRYYISQHEQVNINLILKYPNICWDWDLLTYHKNILISDIINNPHLGWRKGGVESNPNITEEYLLSCKTFPPRTNEWCAGKNISMEFIKKYKPTWKKISYTMSNPNIKYEDIPHNKSITIIKALIRNPSINTEILLDLTKNIDHYFNEIILSRRINKVQIEKYIKIINFDYLSTNPFITPELVLDCKEMGWKWDKLLYNIRIVRYINNKGKDYKIFLKDF